MLFLQMKTGDYLTIGEDITIQFFPDSKSRVRVAIKAPKDLAILRGDVRERTGGVRPKGLIGDPFPPPQAEPQEQIPWFHPADEPVEMI